MREAIIVPPQGFMGMGEARCVNCNAQVATINCGWGGGRRPEGATAHPAVGMTHRPKDKDGMPTFGPSRETIAARAEGRATRRTRGPRFTDTAVSQLQAMQPGSPEGQAMHSRIARAIRNGGWRPEGGPSRDLADPNAIYVYCLNCDMGQRVNPSLAATLYTDSDS